MYSLGLDEGKAKDTFVASNCRAAKLEQEANDLRYKLTQLSSAIADFNAAFNEKYGALAAAGGPEDETASEEGGGSDLKSQLEKISSTDKEGLLNTKLGLTLSGVKG